MVPYGSGQAEGLRRAIENLMTAKLLDAVARPGGLERLLAHRCSGVASNEIRSAERELDLALTSAMAAVQGGGRGEASERKSVEN